MSRTRKKFLNYSDNELLSEFRSNQDKKIIGELYNRYGHLVMGSCLNYLKNKSDAEDTVMEIFIKLGDKIQKHEVKYFKSWLFILTKNECLMQLRKKKDFNSELNEEQVAYTDEVKEKQIQEIKLSELESAIDALEPPQDTIIRLFYLKQLSYKEVSDQLNITLNKVKSAIQNGKRNLKIKLKEHDLFKYTK
ncbi:RNA polymerase sigma factor [Brumimicrobium aurantiacum]|uniref:Sigma-70 family RNA polymerase sigma factor n=1 Tax=Brumimicrobium aurantiacum TaxID=1737063 RepID=A0A3E1EZS2_9FLAO|nr:sigma-70 family RNA polymerase sigma factor [Brumimicrobium aurantiacum]RFC54957.1 sigma-70 family RNA polymerase sigma factor [Brumimicrobium aurantiacum]